MNHIAHVNIYIVILQLLKVLAMMAVRTQNLTKTSTMYSFHKKLGLRLASIYS